MILALVVFLRVLPALAADEKVPGPALSRQAYEAQYPKQGTSAAALEIAELAGKLGIDATVDSGPEARPSPDTTTAAGRAIAACSAYVNAQLQDSSDAVDAPPAAVADFLEEHAAALAGIVAAASGRREIAWDIDVTLGTRSPVPAWAGLTLLQRVLAAQVLLDLRRQDTPAALAGIEAIWQIARSVAVRPELLSELMAMSQARLAVGLLRKVHAPAYGWETRLREDTFLQAFLTAFQNDAWPSADHPGMADNAEMLGRIYRRFADGLIAKSPCAWTAPDLQQAWDVAISGETDPNDIEITISSDAIIRMLLREYRLLVESEMTALILDARAERAASREDEWPARLPDLESKVCPGRVYRYERPGGVTLAFVGPFPGTGESTLSLPPTFRGAPPPTRTPTPTPTRTPTTLTPTPTPRTLRGR
ncbi:MAG TPA: hypothetical protein VMN82_03095 [Thermoanaerobaculia bacterium]|nr:hypothetical protein [Thermoanaerobaculia bacterium]